MKLEMSVGVTEGGDEKGGEGDDLGMRPQREREGERVKEGEREL